MRFVLPSADKAKHYVQVLQICKMFSIKYFLKLRLEFSMVNLGEPAVTSIIQWFMLGWMSQKSSTLSDEKLD